MYSEISQVSSKSYKNPGEIMCQIIPALEEMVSKCHQRWIPTAETPSQMLAIVMAGK